MRLDKEPEILIPATQHAQLISLATTRTRLRLKDEKMVATNNVGEPRHWANVILCKNNGA